MLLEFPPLHMPPCCLPSCLLGDAGSHLGCFCSSLLRACLAWWWLSARSRPSSAIAVCGGFCLSLYIHRDSVSYSRVCWASRLSAAQSLDAILKKANVFNWVFCKPVMAHRPEFRISFIFSLNYREGQIPLHIWGSSVWEFVVNFMKVPSLLNL